MKNLWIACFLLSLFSLASCHDVEELPPPEPPVGVTQNPLPIGKQSLNILAIGNSFTEDGTAYIGEILSATEVSPQDYALYTITVGSTDLKFWSNQLVSTEKFVARRVAGQRNVVDLNEATLSAHLANDWDIVVLQQFSAQAVDYETYNPYLRQLLLAIERLCPNKQVCIAWQLVPAYSSQSPNNYGMAGDSRWRCIAKVTQTMMERDGINCIIPTGTAIQLARHSELQTPYDLTRDHTHLAYGLGRYLAACTWVQTLFAPVFGFSIEGLEANHDLSIAELSDSSTDFIPASSVAVDESNRSLCHQIVLRACHSPFTLSGE